MKVTGIRLRGKPPGERPSITAPGPDDAYADDAKWNWPAMVTSAFDLFSKAVQRFPSPGKLTQVASTGDYGESVEVETTPSMMTERQYTPDGCMDCGAPEGRHDSDCGLLLERYGVGPDEWVTVPVERALDMR